MLGLPSFIEVGGQSVRLLVRRNVRSRRLRLRYDVVEHVFILSVPYGVSSGVVSDFLFESDSWMSSQLVGRFVVPFESGVVIPFRGCDYVLRYCESAGIRVFMGSGEIVCGSLGVKFSERIHAFLRSEARKMFLDFADYYCGVIGEDYGRLRITDSRTRWGSCSGLSTLSFNWRLVMADERVSRYVALHEVCHLRYMNHSRDFWGLVGEVMPDYDIFRRELRVSGSGLRLFGLSV